MGAMSNASAKQRAALEMYVGSDLSMRAIAVYLGLRSVSSVHYAIHREAARRGMRIVVHPAQARRRELLPITADEREGRAAA